MIYVVNPRDYLPVFSITRGIQRVLLDNEDLLWTDQEHLSSCYLLKNSYLKIFQETNKLSKRNIHLITLQYK